MTEAANEAGLKAPAAYDGLPDGARGRAMLVIILGLTLSVLDSSIVNLALPAIARELQASSALTLWGGQRLSARRSGAAAAAGGAG